MSSPELERMRRKHQEFIDQILRGEPVVFGERGEDWVEVEHCAHPVRISIVEHHCHVCSQPATHKIGDESGPRTFHNLTTWLCCNHMSVLGLHCNLYPWFSVHSAMKAAPQGPEDSNG